MARSKMRSAGGFASMGYVLRKGKDAGGLFALYKKLRSKNTCKACALGMGGQHGGMVNESGRFPQFCKKSVQAQAADMAGSWSEEQLTSTSISELSTWSSAQLEKAGRLTFPIIAEPGDQYFHRISWTEALTRSASALEAADPNQVFFYLSGRSSNEAAFLLQLVARAYGSPHVNNCAFYCHTASSVALSSTYGSGTASVVLEDLDQADLAIVAGANPASNHPRLITALMKMRRRGGRVIVINPLRELGLVNFRIPSDLRSLLFGSQVSDLYLQPHIGSDIAVFKALLKGVIEAGGEDTDFVTRFTSGWPEVRDDVQAASWQELEKRSGLERQQLDRAVELILEARRGIFMWAMGLTHHEHGVDNILAFANLALACGWLGRPGVGLLPIRGHSNVQGIGSVGAQPVLKKAFADKLAEIYGVKTAAGQDTYASMCAAEEGDIRVAFQLGGNLYSSNPDLDWAGAALRRIPLTINLSTKLNQGHIHGRGQTTIVLPVLARDEEQQPTSQESMFNFVRLSDGGPANVTGELRSEVEIIAALAEEILPADRFKWSELRSHHELRQAMAKVVPGYASISNIERSRGEFHIDGRTFHEPQFATDDGKAKMAITPVPDEDLAEDELRLMTIRSEGQFNTVVYEEQDVYRGIDRRDVVMMSAEDAKRLELEEGDLVEVKSDVGSLRVHVTLASIRPGNLAMYFPEANVLVPRRLDRRSKTPAYKNVAVRVTRTAQKN